MLLLLVTVTVFAVSSHTLCSAESTYYIKPTPNAPCPREPCHTLSQYAEKYYWNFSSNTTMVFLPGDHTLNVTISMGSVSNYTVQLNQTSTKYFYYPHPSLTLIGSPSSLPGVTSRIVCTWPAGFTFSRIGELHISALAFISCGHDDSAAVNILSVQNINISNCTFQNNTNSLLQFSPNVADKQGGAVFVYNSTLTVTGSIFQKNFALAGGALYAYTNNTLTVSENTFQNNSAGYGGALEAYTKNTLTLSENVFQNNSAGIGGGVLSANKNNNITVSENTFQNNFAGYAGGALVTNTNNTLTLSENAFQNNSAGYNGGALYAYTNNALTFSGNIFQNNSAVHGGALVAVKNNALTLSENTFQNNSADNSAGALLAYTNNTLTLSENTFQNNSADYSGGALYADMNNTLTLSENIFHNNSADYGGALDAYTNNTLTLSENTFQNNSADHAGGALNAFTSNTLTLSENTFQNNSADIRGGALYAFINNTLTLSENTFQNNAAGLAGGALVADIKNTLTLLENTFQNNSAHFGGALFAYTINTLTLSENIFQNNSAVHGGALMAGTNNTLTLSENTFQNNSVDYSGGALSADNNNNITGSENTFQNNSAASGGALNAVTNNTLTLSENTFQNNSADNSGGALDAVINNTLTLSENTFQNNSADNNGGAIYAYTNNTITLKLNNFTDNSAGFGGALLIRQSKIKLTGNTLTRNTAQSYGGAIFCFANSTISILESHILNNNVASYGGGIAALECQILMAGDLLIANNNASFGGGLYVSQSRISGHAHFANNFASEGGGAVYSSGSMLHFKQHITIIGNSARNGGGVLLTEGSQLHLRPNTTINFTNNFVQKKGGAIKVENHNPLSSCAEASCEFIIDNGCFFQIETQRQYYGNETNISEIAELHNVRIVFQNNTALEAGTALYGGSVDNCSLNFIDTQLRPQSSKFESTIYHPKYICPNSGEVFDYITASDQQSLDFSSDPLYICPCEGRKIDCSASSITRSVYPGGTIEIPIIAYGQRNGTAPAVIHVRRKREIEINNLENTQSINNSCTALTYTVQSSAVGTAQEMTLYAESPCSLKERTVSSPLTNAITVLISIRKCPPGFELLQHPTVCNCSQRLQRFTDTCKIHDGTIERRPEFWVGYVPNSTFDDLILHPHCPFDYCTFKTIYIAVDDSDEQCSNNRTGLLCGSCSQNLSLALGTNRCLQCSNGYLWLLVAFAFAGVALVLLLLVLRLTVAVGTINGLLFYANVFSINSAILFRAQIPNVLTVFIAWLNLDLGIETCFYNGMDAYTKTWLQFAFPVYVWALVCIIILISHYSSKVATILGTNPIAVLATLFLLSYTKFLRTVIAALSYTLLEYPNNSQITVWLYDGNIRYLSNKHIPLFTASLVCLIVLFLPYTIFLIFSQWLRSKSGQWMIFHWVNHYRVLPFLDAYHAPYTDKYRYWTGLMLLVRCILFLLFAFNALGDPSVNLLAIGSVTAALMIVYAGFGNRIYKTWYLNMLELSFIANLCILALATLYVCSTGGNQNAVTFTSISIAFATFIGIVTYHSAQQIKNTPKLWRKVFPQNDIYELVPQTDEDSHLEGISPPSPPDPSDGCATVTHINFRELLDLNELREPCMEMVD